MNQNDRYKSVKLFLVYSSRSAHETHGPTDRTRPSCPAHDIPRPLALGTAKGYQGYATVEKCCVEAIFKDITTFLS